MVSSFFSRPKKLVDECGDDGQRAVALAVMMMTSIQLAMVASMGCLAITWDHSGRYEVWCEYAELVAVGAQWFAWRK